MFKEIKKNGSKSTFSTLDRIKKVRSSFVREYPPLRGFSIKWHQDWKVVNIVKDLHEKVFSYINNDPSLSPEQKSSILTWEQFQSVQKGPAAPINLNDYDTMVLDGMEVPQFDIPPEEISIIMEVFSSLITYLKGFCSIDVEGINFENSWDQLPNQTLRGYPYNQKGKDCDLDIKMKGGNSALTAIRYAESNDNFICFCGYRVQGKPYPGPAKIRPVFITPTYSQYFDVGIVKESMNQLARCPVFAGWQDPSTRLATILQANQIAEKNDLTRIQLDYSAYDKHIHPFFQKLVATYFEHVCSTGHDFIKRRNIMFNKWRDSQVVVMPDKRNNIQFIPIPYQLPSGEIRTQHDGTLIGLILMGYLWKKLFNSDINWSICNQLGDDAVFPVPKAYLEEVGYEKLLESISYYLNLVGFQLNPKKAYPTSEMAFLQRLYNFDLDIVGIGSFCRSISSFFFKEKFSKKIPGIKNIWALEIVSQITILSDPFSSSKCNIHGVANHLTQWWVDNDNKLNAILVYLKSKNKCDPNNLFKFIIKLSGATFDQILDDRGLLSYDHSGLKLALESTDYGQTFPILSYLCQCKTKSLSDAALNRILNLEDSFVNPKQITADDLIIDGDG